MLSLLGNFTTSGSCGNPFFNRMNPQAAFAMSALTGKTPPCMSEY
jgi:hypothetical protein